MKTVENLSDHIHYPQCGLGLTEVLKYSYNNQVNYKLKQNVFVSCI